MRQGGFKELDLVLGIGFGELGKSFALDSVNEKLLANFRLRFLAGFESQV